MKLGASVLVCITEETSFIVDVVRCCHGMPLSFPKPSKRPRKK
jgi:hypothetical protein